MRRYLRAHIATVAVLLIIGGFVLMAVQRLSTVPLPDTDESMTLQVPYEMLYRGKLAFPMFQFLGGNIENTWHSFTPVFFVILSGFMKIFGWGVTRGRAFNLAFAALVLLMVYVIGRRLIDWRVGLIGVVLMISDPVFLARSRLIRNDLPAALFGLLAFYLFERAEELRSKWYHLAAGLAAGAAVMCHTNLIYILIVIGVLMLAKHGLKTLKSKNAWLFAAGTLAMMSYEIIYDLVDYKNFVLQNRRDKIHFRVLDPWGWWGNFRHELKRYENWYHASDVDFAAPLTLLHLFFLITIVAAGYLIIRAIARRKHEQASCEPRVRVLIATTITVLFFALVTQRKILQYVVHLSPWFALCAGMMLRDGLAMIGKLKSKPWRWAGVLQGMAAAIAGLLALFYAFQFVGQYVPKYLREVRNPDLVTFGEVKEVLRDCVPEGLCPASVGSGSLWLAFPEQDRCFFSFAGTTIEEPLDLAGRNYALFVRPKSREKEKALTGAAGEHYHLIAELLRTAYGTFNVYYTGKDPGYLSLQPKRYYFFGSERGHVSQEQVAAGSVVWSVVPPPWKDVSTTIELKPKTIYQVVVDDGSQDDWVIEVIDERTGVVIGRASAKKDESKEGVQQVFKTSSGGKVRLAVKMQASDPSSVLSISRIRVREVAPL